VSIFNNETEKAVLSCLLVGRDESPEIFSMLVPDAFYNPKNKLVYETMYSMYIDNEAIDIVTVYDTICAKGLEEQTGGLNYLTILSDGIYSVNPIQYAKKVDEDYVKRRILSASENILGYVSKDPDDDILTIKNNCLRLLSEIGTSSIHTEKTGRCCRTLSGLYNTKTWNVSRAKRKEISWICRPR
jgi:replicative DNA helicase